MDILGLSGRFWLENKNKTANQALAPTDTRSERNHKNVTKPANTLKTAQLQ